MVRELFNGTKPYEMLTYVNDVTDGYFGPLFLLIIWIAIFASVDLSIDRKFATASFPVLILAVSLRMLGALQNMPVYIAVLLVFLSIVFMYLSRTRYDVSS